jgi:tRNA-dihydrouridine synthase
VAQIFSSNPEKMRETAKLIAELGFDAIDINMGCPDRSVEKQGAGAAHIKDYSKAREVIRAVKEGAPNLPVSVKTRVGYNKVEIDTWIPELLAEGIALLTIHARTRKEMSDVPARWEHVAEVVALRDKLQSDIAPEDRTLIFGNGDVYSLNDADKKAFDTKADGVMVGRGIFGTPWFFDRNRLGEISIKEKLNIMVEHTKLFEELMTGVKNFAVMKKHFKAYVSGWDGAKDLRMKLMGTNNSTEVEQIVKEYLSTTVN